jgi:hypothetical protein
MIDARTTLLSALIVQAFGCSNGGTLNIGNTGDQVPQLADYVGSWDGHAEAWSFGADGSDRVRVTIDASGTGTMQLGDTTLPAATDPDIVYPPGAIGGPCAATGCLWEGFPYPTHLTRVEAGRLQFGIDQLDIFSGWCALQTPVQLYNSPPGGGALTIEPGVYSCAPNEVTTSTINLPDGGMECTFVGPDGSVQTVDCTKQILCLGYQPCTCDQSGCVSQSSVNGATDPAQYPYPWDSGLDAQPGSMTATLVISREQVMVHLTRQ